MLPRGPCWQGPRYRRPTAPLTRLQVVGLKVQPQPLEPRGMTPHRAPPDVVDPAASTARSTTTLGSTRVYPTGPTSPQQAGGSTAGQECRSPAGRSAAPSAVPDIPENRAGPPDHPEPARHHLLPVTWSTPALTFTRADPLESQPMLPRWRARDDREETMPSTVRAGEATQRVRRSLMNPRQRT